jgi:hypothetical protein
MLHNTLRTPIASRLRGETSSLQAREIHEPCSLQPTASMSEALTDYTLPIEV